MPGQWQDRNAEQRQTQGTARQRNRSPGQQPDRSAERRQDWSAEQRQNQSTRQQHRRSTRQQHDRGAEQRQDWSAERRNQFELPEFVMPWRPRVNPRLDSARREGKAWAREVGVIGPGGIWPEWTYDSFELPLFAALTHPDAPGEKLAMLTRWDIWAFAIDDFFVLAFKSANNMVGAKAFVDRLPRFMSDDPEAVPPATSPVERGLADLWARTAPGLSGEQRRRFPDHVMEFAAANLWELGNNAERRVPDPVEYLEMRRQTSGTGLSVNLGFLMSDAELPAAVTESRPMRALVDAFADNVGLRNDIFSFRKEIEVEREVNNGVLVIKEFLGCGLQHAVDTANDLMTARLRRFEHIAATELPLLDLDNDVRKRVLDHVDGLRAWLAGDLQWYRMTRRYMCSVATRGPGKPVLSPGSGLTRWRA